MGPWQAALVIDSYNLKQGHGGGDSRLGGV